MKITSIVLKNFRGFDETPISPLGSFSIFVGKSGSGKTSAFEAIDLFFQNFDNTSEKILEAFEDRYWHKRLKGKKIEIKIGFELSTSEVARLPEESMKRLGITKTKKGLVGVAEVTDDKGTITWRNFVELPEGKNVPISPQPDPVAPANPPTSVTSDLIERPINLGDLPTFLKARFLWVKVTD